MHRFIDIGLFHQQIGVAVALVGRELQLGDITVFFRSGWACAVFGAVSS
jgi:hypothetical protein